MSETRVDQILARLKNNRVLAIVVVLGIIITTVSAVVGSIFNLTDRFSSLKASEEPYTGHAGAFAVQLHVEGPNNAEWCCRLTATRLPLAELSQPKAPSMQRCFATQPGRLSGMLCKFDDLRDGDPG